MNQYEAMFVFDPTFAAKFDNAEKEITKIMDRASAQDVIAKKWDDRRLAYKINGRKRGIYALVHFRAGGDAITGIERDAKLSENVLRLLVVRVDHLTDDDWKRFGAEPVPSADQDSSKPTTDASDKASVKASTAVAVESTKSTSGNSESTPAD